MGGTPGGYQPLPSGAPPLPLPQGAGLPPGPFRVSAALAALEKSGLLRVGSGRFVSKSMFSLCGSVRFGSCRTPVACHAVRVPRVNITFGMFLPHALLVTHVKTVACQCVVCHRCLDRSRFGSCSCRKPFVFAAICFFPVSLFGRCTEWVLWFKEGGLAKGLQALLAFGGREPTQSGDGWRCQPTSLQRDKR
jgi:hypothetical protein